MFFSDIIITIHHPIQCILIEKFTLKEYNVFGFVVCGEPM
jgi:hypothetical protein